MNEKTKERLESEINVPAPPQPVDKLRIHEAHAADVTLGVPQGFGRTEEYAVWSHCFADDE